MTIENTVTAAVAGGAVASPLWLPWINEVSMWAGPLLQVMGLIWIAVKLYDRFFKKPGEAPTPE